MRYEQLDKETIGPLRDMSDNVVRDEVADRLHDS